MKLSSLVAAPVVSCAVLVAPPAAAASALYVATNGDDGNAGTVDSHGNRDPRKNGESADGLAIKEGSGSGNSWNLGGSWSSQSTDPDTVTGSRNADGSIRPSGFLRPAHGADLGVRFP